MKEYLRLHRLIKKRSLEEKIAFTIKPLINIFVDEDKKYIVSFFYYLYILTEVLQYGFLAILCLIITHFINYEILEISIICAVTNLFIVYNFDNNEVTEFFLELRFFLTKVNIRKRKRKNVVCLFLTKNIWLYIVISGIAIFFVLRCHILVRIAITLISLSINLIISFVLLRLYKKIDMIALVLKNDNSDLVQEKDTTISITVEKKSEFYKLLKRKTYYEYNGSFYRVNKKIITVIIGLIIVGISFIGIDRNYVYILSASLVATITNVYVSYYYKDIISSQDMRITNFYFINKFRVRNKYIKSTFLFLLSESCIDVIILVVSVIIAGRFEWVSLLVSAITFIIYTCALMICTSRMYNPMTADLDEIKDDLDTNLLKDFFEDYIIMGLPVIIISYWLVSYKLKGDIASFLFYISGYGCFLIAYIVLGKCSR